MRIRPDKLNGSVFLFPSTSDNDVRAFSECGPRSQENFQDDRGITGHVSKVLSTF